MCLPLLAESHLPIPARQYLCLSEPNPAGTWGRITQCFCLMREAYSMVWSVLVSLFRSRVSLEAEVLILRHQLNIQRRHRPKRPAIGPVDRLIFVGLYRLVPNAIKALTIVKPDTVIRWHRAGFQIVLALEIAAQPRSTSCTIGNSPADPRDQRRQPVVGSAKKPWRASQARHRHRPDQRRKVHGAEEGPPSQGWKGCSRPNENTESKTISSEWRSIARQAPERHDGQHGCDSDWIRLFVSLRQMTKVTLNRSADQAGGADLSGAERPRSRTARPRCHAELRNSVAASPAAPGRGSGRPRRVSRRPAARRPH